MKLIQWCSFRIVSTQKKFHSHIYNITFINKKQNILLYLAKISVSSSYKGQLVLKFLHNTKHGMYYQPAKNQTQIQNRTPRIIIVYEI